MKFLNSLKIGQKLGLFASFLIVFIIINAFISFFTLEYAKINGDTYNKIILGKDLVADILPPPAYIIESYLVCNHLYFEKDEKKITELIDYSYKLSKDFNDRQSFWLNNLEDGKLKFEMTKNAKENALKFYEVRDNEFIPAIKHGDKELAYILLTTKLKFHYDNHRSNIDNVVNMAFESNALLESKTQKQVESNLNYMLLIAAISILISILFTFLTRNMIVKPIKYSIDIAKKLAKGDFNI